MPVLEKWVETHVNEELYTWGVLYIKNRPIENGYPDRLYILPTGLHVWIEFKKPGEEPSKIQLYRMKQLNNRKAIAGWTDDYRTAVDVCKALMAAARLPREGGPTLARPVRWWIIPGPRAREDYNLLGYLQDLKAYGLRPEDARRGTVAGDSFDMAGRD